MTTFLRTLIVAVLIFATLVACMASPTPMPTPTLTPTPELIWRSVSCEWRGTARAWIDENANGVWDKGEAPLSGVEIKAFGGNITLVDPVTTDAQGRVSLYTEASGDTLISPSESLTDYCKREELRGRWQVEVRAKIPPGYLPTTAYQIAFPPSLVLPPKALYFGFVPVAPTETATPSSTAALMATATPAP